ncbi:MAG: LeuA family protein [bacterium JZ-2024 1]
MHHITESGLSPDETHLIYDWNEKEGDLSVPQGVILNDETLRDGLQSPSVRDPLIGEKIEILHLMAQLGIRAADIGYAGASGRTREDVRVLAREILNNRLPIEPNCAARTHPNDIQPIIDISHEVGIPIQAAVFLGSSPIRQYAEGWDMDFLLRSTETAVTMAKKAGLPVMYVTEDTTRSHPETLETLYTTAINYGADNICIADTVGHATPAGVRALVSFIKKLVDRVNPKVVIDWHGHRDRGLDIINSLVAIEAGARRVHGCALGIGERVGNTPIDLLAVNLKMLGWWDGDVSVLPRYVEAVSRAVGVPIPPNYPVFGADAFRTATGVHAAAVIKAKRLSHRWIEDRVYTGVPPSLFGRRNEIEIGPMSGESNVVFWLESHGYQPTPDLVARIFQRAKSSRTLLTEEQILAEISAVTAEA